MSEVELHPLTGADRNRLRQFMIAHWGDEIMIVRDEIVRPHEHDGFLAWLDNELVGVVTYRIRDGRCEVLSLDSEREGQGIGTALINAVVDVARRAGCRRVWLITTNDNLNALKFYQKRGFRLVAVYPGAVDESRKLKPSIAPIGEHGIPLRDEIELAMAL